MKSKNMVLIAVSLWAIPSFATMPVANLSFSQQNQIEAAQQVLEAKIGKALSADQRAQLAILTQDEKPETLVEVSTQSPTKAIYCVGASGAAFESLLGAACVHIWSLKTYTVNMIGVGLVGKLELNAFRLKVTFDPSRYDAKFDPLPGNYAVGSRGGTLGAGVTLYIGDSGNKTLTAASVNVGAGIDLGTISLFHIEP